MFKNSLITRRNNTLLYVRSMSVAIIRAAR
jgi:hypothetical protein